MARGRRRTDPEHGETPPQHRGEGDAPPAELGTWIDWVPALVEAHRHRSTVRAQTDSARPRGSAPTSAATTSVPPTRLDDVRPPSAPPGDLPSHPASARRAVWLRERGPTFPSNNWVAPPPAFEPVPATTGEFAAVGDGHSWVMVYEGEVATALRYELFRETATGHRLHGMLPSPLARCATCGVVAYHLGDATWALVELTGSGGAEPLPLPRHTRVESFDALRDLMARHEHSG
jgi:hypothetical protein